MRFSGELVSLALETPYQIVLSTNAILVFLNVSLIYNVTIDVARLFNLACFFYHVINELGAWNIPMDCVSFSEVWDTIRIVGFFHRAHYSHPIFLL